MAHKVTALYCVCFVSALTSILIEGINAFAITPESGTCVDKVACYLYGQDICTDIQYNQWVQDNCPKYCQHCDNFPTQQNGVGKLMDSNSQQGTCQDAVDNCATFGPHICSDVNFYNWVDTNCKKTCNRCVKTCLDKVPNCPDYGDDLCTNLVYYNWVQINCPKFCARCGSRK